MLTGQAVIFMLDVANARQPDGVPVKYTDGMDPVARGLEACGLIERHHVGAGKGACLTATGRQLLNAIAEGVNPTLSKKETVGTSSDEGSG